MKVKCIDSEGTIRVSNGVVYKVVAIDDEYYTIIDNAGEYCDMFKYRFTPFVDVTEMKSGFKFTDEFGTSCEVKSITDKESRIVIYADQFTMNDDVVKEWIEKMKEQSKTDTPQIEVGSEWVDPWRHTCTVLGVGEEEVFIKNHTMNLEHTYKKDKFLSELKPKPKTVTMYFHKTKTGEYYAQETKCTGYIFTKEIEL